MGSDVSPCHLPLVGGTIPETHHHPTGVRSSVHCQTQSEAHRFKHVSNLGSGGVLPDSAFVQELEARRDRRRSPFFRLRLQGRSPEISSTFGPNLTVTAPRPQHKSEFEDTINSRLMDLALALLLDQERSWRGLDEYRADGTRYCISVSKTTRPQLADGADMLEIDFYKKRKSVGGEVKPCVHGFVTNKISMGHQARI
ncbi:hypothetical protein MUK42_05670 [Musa troglodytarum]|uniref:Uncharacterized protein n=1 Tax=Musa troglodytarum TaxID=320322 RepID=A0A9E7GKD3_9LILI|nr:hypothetical protein MUK42_05670 [Musa troglodytarum]